MDANLVELLSAYPELQCLPSSRIRCNLTGHEMPSNFETVHRFVQGRKFQRVKRAHDQMRQNERYFEDRGSYFFCKLTKRRIAKEGDDIERHVNGRRFLGALAKANAADENGNKMDTNSLNGVDSPSEPPLIDDSDESDADELLRYECGDGCSTSSSSSSIRDVEAVDNGELYPELTYSDHAGEGDSDYDFNAMDTDLDAELTTKRKLDSHVLETPAHKRRRC